MFKKACKLHLNLQINYEKTEVVGGGVEVGDVTAFMVKVEASDGVMNCRRETGN